MPTPILNKYLGRNRDHFDPRDSLLRVSHYQAAALPKSANASEGITLPDYNQLNLGSCTANSGVEFMRWIARRFPKAAWPDVDLSRLGLYWLERSLPWNNSVNSDSGASSRDIFYCLVHFGVPTESEWPYDVNEFTVNRTTVPGVMQSAAQHKLGAYHRVVDLPTLKSVIAGDGKDKPGYPVSIGFVVYESFESIGSNGVMPMPSPNEQVLGGHEVLAYAYDDSGGGYIRCRNWWGTDWGLDGEFFMPYDFLLNYNLSQWDGWVGHLGKPWI